MGLTPIGLMKLFGKDAGFDATSRMGPLRIDPFFQGSLHQDFYLPRKQRCV